MYLSEPSLGERFTRYMQKLFETIINPSEIWQKAIKPKIHIGEMLQVYLSVVVLS